MGRKENIKRMKRMRTEKLKRQTDTQRQLEMDQIAGEATNKLIGKLSPFEKIRRNTGPLKYSDVLKDFVRPYLDDCKDFHETKELFNAGAIAWNMATTKQFDGDTTYEEVVRGVEKQLKVSEAVDFLKELVDRKIKYFAHHKVIISDVELTENEKAFGISVAVAQLD